VENPVGESEGNLQMRGTAVSVQLSIFGCFAYSVVRQGLAGCLCCATMTVDWMLRGVGQSVASCQLVPISVHLDACMHDTVNFKDPRTMEESTH
jgi:hypothetical protein